MWNSHEIKSVKNFIIKKSATEVFQVCISITLALILAVHCYCGDNVKRGLISKHCLKENDNMVVEKISQ